MRKEFLSGVPKDEGKAVKAFVKANAENALKTKPKVCDRCAMFVTSASSQLCFDHSGVRGRFSLVMPSAGHRPSKQYT